MNYPILTDFKQDQLQTNLMRRSSESDDVDIWTDIYQDEINLATWQRALSPQLWRAAQQLLETKHLFRVSTSVTPDDAFDSLYEILGANTAAQHISGDVADIVAMFCCLFELKQVGLRFTTLDRAMCPKFHVDRVPCRLVTTYSGTATQWLPHHAVNRAKLGMGSKGMKDEESGLYQSHHDIQQLNTGDVALLKGESWPSNEGAGLVHRSPSLGEQEKRLLLTLDFS